MSKLFSALADDGQYVCLYLLESKIGYMALKKMSVLYYPSMRSQSLAKSNIDIKKNEFEIAIQKKQFWNKTRNFAEDLPTDHEGPL